MRESSSESKGRRLLVWAVGTILVVGVVLVGLRGCTAMPWNKATATGGNVSVTITRDFGRVLIREGQVKARGGESVLDAVKRVAAVKTDYGGGFVSAIEGVGSGAGGLHSDWFYYVNGILSGVGASQYQVRPGDSVWWDFHEWSKGDFTPAVVGAYPMPFTRGYDGASQKSRLLYGVGMEDLAREVGHFLQTNGAQIEYAGKVRDAAPSGDGPVMAFLTLRQAGEIPWVAGLLDRASNKGVFVALDGGNLIPLNAVRSPTSADGRVTAAVLCTGSGMGDGSPVWLVICDGAEGARQVGRLLTSEYGSLRMKVGLTIDSKGEVLALPR